MFDMVGLINTLALKTLFGKNILIKFSSNFLLLVEQILLIKQFFSLLPRVMLRFMLDCHLYYLTYWYPWMILAHSKNIF